MLYLLIGKDRSLKKEFIDELQKKHFPAGSEASLNSQEFQSEEDLFQEFRSFIQTAPFLAPCRLATLWEVDALKKEEKESLVSFASSLPEYAHVVLATDSGNTKSEFLSALALKAKLVTCHTPFEEGWPSYLQKRAQKKGIQMAPGASQAMLERVGRDTLLLGQALEALTVFIYPKKELTSDDVGDFLGRSAEEDTFSLADMILEKNLTQALFKIKGLREQGTRGFEILSVLAGQWERLHRALSALEIGVAPQAVAAQQRVPAFLADKFIAKLRRLKISDVLKHMAATLAYDELVKTGRLDEKFAVEFLATELCLGKSLSLQSVDF